MVSHPSTLDSQLLQQHFDTLAETPEAVAKLRQFILELAVQGKLVGRNRDDDPASELIKLIQVEKSKRTKDGQLKKQASLPKVTPDEAWFEIPTGWEWVRLGMITQVVMGQSPPGETYNKSGEGIPLINGPVEFSRGPFGKTVVNQYTTAPTNVCEEGDLLLCVRGSTTGRTNIAGFRACIGRGVAAIRPFFADDYVRFFVWRLRASIIAMGRGIAFPSVNKQQIEKLPVPLPPLAEQRRIVAKVEELLALCDELEARQTAAREHRTRLVRSALDHLTTAQDESDFKKHSAFCLQHSELLFDSVPALRQAILSLAVQGRLVSRDTKKAIQDLPMEDLVGQKNLKNGLSLRQTAGVAKYSCLPISAMRDGLIRCSDRKPVVLNEDRAKPYLIKANDVFIVRGNGSTHLVGRAGIVEGNPKDLIFPDLFIRVPLDGAKLDCRYFVLAWNSPEMRRRIESVAKTTAGILKINQGHIAALSLPVPPLAEQNRIVAKVDELMRWCDALEARLTAARTTATHLLDATLHQILTA